MWRSLFEGSVDPQGDHFINDIEHFYLEPGAFGIFEVGGFLVLVVIYLAVVKLGRLTELLSDSIHAPVALALDREHAIERDIDRRHARMAATLIQGALFDRRTERDAHSQRELIDQALSRCHARIAELQRLRHITSAAIRPAFSLIAW